MDGASSRARMLVTDPWVVDVALAAALTVMAQVQLPAGTAAWLRACMVLTTGSLAWRRQVPMVVVIAVAASVAVMGISSDPPSVFGEYLAVMLASFTVAERCDIVTAVGGLLLLVAGIVAHDWRSPEFGGVSGFVSDSAIPVVIWLVGRAVYVQRGRVDRSRDVIRQLERERAALAEAAVAEERLRLARELHDVVTHSVSVIVIQAQGAQRVLDDPAMAGEALRVIETAARSTLTEMRRLLGLLRDEGPQPRAPQPRLADLQHLVDQVRAAGLPVTMRITGTPVPLDAGVELAAYRVVQEALTNSLKYARPATAEVAVTWQEGALDVVVTDTGRTPSRWSSEGGRGLLGMRERVSTYGGELQAGPVDPSGFRVRCRLPVAARP